MGIIGLMMTTECLSQIGYASLIVINFSIDDLYAGHA